MPARIPIMVSPRVLDTAASVVPRVASEISLGPMDSRQQLILRPALPIGLQDRPFPVTLDLQFDKFHSIARLKMHATARMSAG